MLIIRSVAFNVLFYLNLIIQLLAALPTLIMPRGAILAVARFWARSSIWLLRAVCGPSSRVNPKTKWLRKQASAANDVVSYQTRQRF